MKKQIIMQYRKSTKGTHVFANDEDNTPVPSIYIKRSALPSQPPESITLTIEFDDK